MSTTAKKSAPKKPRQRKPSHAPMAFVGEAPCPVCGSEWLSPGVNTATMETVTMCANLWHNMIAQLRADRLALAKLAAETPQFDNPVKAWEAQVLRDRILAAAEKPHPEAA